MAQVNELLAEADSLLQQFKQMDVLGSATSASVGVTLRQTDSSNADAAAAAADSGGGRSNEDSGVGILVRASAAYQKVRETPSFWSNFCTESDPFTKTGSGQTGEKLSAKGRFLAGAGYRRDQLKGALRCAKRHFWRHLCIKAIVLPRQARDKHRESTQKKSGCVSAGLKRAEGLMSIERRKARKVKGLELFRKRYGEDWCDKHRLFF